MPVFIIGKESGRALAGENLRRKPGNAAYPQSLQW